VSRRSRTPLEVWKFGGASLADTKAVDHAAALIAGHAGPLIVVASALAGITDLLLDGAAHAAARRDGDAHAAADTFARRHRQIATDLVPGVAREGVYALIDLMAREFLELCGAAAALGGLAPDVSDLVVARGERTSATILAAVVAARRPASFIDGAALVRTDASTARPGASHELPASPVARWAQ
jgi:aspartokinase